MMRLDGPRGHDVQVLRYRVTKYLINGSTVTNANLSMFHRTDAGRTASPGGFTRSWLNKKEDSRMENGRTE